MEKKFGYWADLKGIQFHESNMVWIQAMPLGTYKHPIFGDIKFDEARMKRFEENFKKNVVGTDLDIDYEHKFHTGEAAGWVKAVESRGKQGLHLQVQFTDDAVVAIKAGKWKYFSPEFSDKWTHPKTNVEHTDVLRGGGLTNRPFLKDILPVNLSELTFEVPGPSKEEGVDPKQLREWLKLSETATDEEVKAKLQELAKKEEPKNDPPTPPKADTEKMLEEVKKLFETNPQMKALTDLVAEQQKKLDEMAGQIKADHVTRRLNESDQGKTVLAPAAKEAMRKILLGEDIPGQAEAFLKLLSEGTAIVELGERGGKDPTKLNESDAEKEFEARARKLMEADKSLDYSSALIQVAREDPKLFSEYRDASTSFKI